MNASRVGNIRQFILLHVNYLHNLLSLVLLAALLNPFLPAALLTINNEINCRRSSRLLGTFQNTLQHLAIQLRFASVQFNSLPAPPSSTVAHCN